MKLDILVVDDSWAMRKFITKQARAATDLIGQSFEAANGKEALEQLQKQPVDIVLCDIHMPELDGLGLAQAMRADDSLKDIPVVVISSDPAPAREDEFRKLGAIGYVEKPFTPAKLGAELERLLGLAKMLVADA